MDVIKRDGSRENFDPAKIAKVVKAAGLDSQKAEKLAGEVIQELKGKSQVTSLQIRDIVSNKLKTVDEYAAGLFDWYQKTRQDKTN